MLPVWAFDANAQNRGRSALPVDATTASYSYKHSDYTRGSEKKWCTGWRLKCFLVLYTFHARKADCRLVYAGTR
jgi:hypothetical protein